MSGRITRIAVTFAAVTLAGVGMAVLVSSAAIPDGAPAVAPTEPTATETSEGPTSTVPHFGTGQAARLAAESLIGAYIQSQFLTPVSDIACSVPESGDIGQQFTCYGLKSDGFVIAMRASIAEDRLIELELLFNQTEPTTPQPPETTEAEG